MVAEPGLESKYAAALSAFRVRLRARNRLRKTWGRASRMIILALRRWVVVRLGSLRSDRLGHYSMDTEVALCDLDARKVSAHGRFLDIWFDNPPICNRALQAMWRRKLRVWPRWVAGPAFAAIESAGDSDHIVSGTVNRDVKDQLVRFPPHVSFLPGELKEARRQLEALGIPADAEFVCLHNRDAHYLMTANPEIDWSYHDYRDSEIASYLLAAEALADRGYWVVRMGAGAAAPLESGHSRVIDYARSGHRSDLLDIYLAAHCRFFLSTGSGIDGVAEMFRRPQLYVNYLPTGGAHVWLPSSMVVFKHQLDSITGEGLSLAQILKRGTMYADESRHYIEASVSLRDNSAEEIRDAAIDMDDYLSDPTSPSEDDDQLNSSFWSQYPLDPAVHSPSLRMRVPGSYLRANPGLYS